MSSEAKKAFQIVSDAPKQNLVNFLNIYNNEVIADPELFFAMIRYVDQCSLFGKQKDFASLLAVSPMTVQRWIRGDNPPIEMSRKGVVFTIMGALYINNHWHMI